jgi:hypothetical protein
MRRGIRRWRSARGFSAPEAAAVMAGLSILTATAAPNLQEFLEIARVTKARGDLRVIAVSIVRLMSDVGPSLRPPGRAALPNLIVGPGEPPLAETRETAPWAEPVVDPSVQTFDAHLVDNTAGYPVTSDGPRWRGPYMEGLSPDPWGTRYALNAAFLAPGSGAPAVVLSAGPNRIVETPFRLTGFTAFGDVFLSSSALVDEWRSAERERHSRSLGTAGRVAGGRGVGRRRRRWAGRLGARRAAAGGRPARLHPDRAEHGGEPVPARPFAGTRRGRPRAGGRGAAQWRRRPQCARPPGCRGPWRAAVRSRRVGGELARDVRARADRAHVAPDGGRAVDERRGPHPARGASGAEAGAPRRRHAGDASRPRSQAPSSWFVRSPPGPTSPSRWRGWTIVCTCWQIGSGWRRCSSTCCRTPSSTITRLGA